MKESLMVRFLYQSALGRVCLKALTHPKLSQVAGIFLSSRMSKPLVSYYIYKHKIDMDNIVIPERGFASFNDFFTRKRKNMESMSAIEDQLISPCDGFLSLMKINCETVFEVKNTKYHLKDLLEDETLSRDFEDGLALIFRLTPANYHRYCYPTRGRIVSSKRIEGILHCVRPIALSTLPVFIQNSREYQVISTEKFGTVVQMEVGALLVGKIQNHKRIMEKMVVHTGEEKGYFEFGGSTIILLLGKNAVCLENKYESQIGVDVEIPVRLGEILGRK